MFVCTYIIHINCRYSYHFFLHCTKDTKMVVQTQILLYFYQNCNNFDKNLKSAVLLFKLKTKGYIMLTALCCFEWEDRQRKRV